VAKQTFQYVDMRIFRMLWRWAKRRHPNKNAYWVKKKYFRTQGTRNWVFSARSRDREGDPVWVTLFYAAQMPIRRHVKIRAKATPYDPAYRAYFERRVRRKGFGGNQTGVPD
jgi:RNA-directed DNA polymerase